MYPLKKHIPLISPTTSPPPDSLASAGYCSASSEKSLLLMKENLERQLCTDRRASVCSLNSEQRSSESNVESKIMDGMCPREREDCCNCQTKCHLANDCGKQEGKEGKEEREEAKTVVTSSTIGSACSSTNEGFHSPHQDCPIAEGEGEMARPDGNSRRDSASDESVVVSASNLLSPEAQLLTQEILLETESLQSDLSSKNPATTTAGEQSAATPTRQGLEHTQNTSFSSCDALSEDSSSEEISRHQLAEKESRLQLAEQMSRLRLAEQTSRLQLAEQTSRLQVVEHTCRHPISEQSSRQEQASPLKNRSSEQLEEAISAHNELKLVAISRQHSTAIPARPQSALWERAREERTSTANKVAKRPQSAVQVHHKQVEKTSTIFVDLSKLHPLHAEDVADNSDDEDGKYLF